MMQDALECVRAFLREEGFDVRDSEAIIEHLMVIKPFFALIGCDDGTKLHVSMEPRIYRYTDWVYGKHEKIKTVYFDLHNPASLQDLAAFLRAK